MTLPGLRMFFGSNAVFRARMASSSSWLVHHLLHLVPPRQEFRIVARTRCIKVEMAIAVAQMAEADRTRAGHDGVHRKGRLGQEGGDRRHRYSNVMLDG